MRVGTDYDHRSIKDAVSLVDRSTEASKLTEANVSRKVSAMDEAIAPLLPLYVSR